MKKTSISVPENLWRRFRALNLLEGRESSEVLTELIEAHLDATPGGTLEAAAKKKGGGRSYGSR